MNENCPCINCITLVTCSPIGVCTNGVRHLAFNCPMLLDFLDYKGDYDVEKMFDAFDIFRSVKDGTYAKKRKVSV
jgi:hypothetical protein